MNRADKSPGQDIPKRNVDYDPKEWPLLAFLQQILEEKGELSEGEQWLMESEIDQLRKWQAENQKDTTHEA